MKLFISLLLTLMIALSAFGQEGRIAKKEKIKALKIAFITKQLELTADEAQKFWPIYNSYDKQMSEIHHTEREVLKDSRDRFDSMDEQSAKSTLKNIQSFEEQKLAARKKLLSSLENKLSYKKTLLLLKSEGDFRRDLLYKLRGERGKSRGSRSPE